MPLNCGTEFMIILLKIVKENIDNCRIIFNTPKYFEIFCHSDMEASVVNEEQSYQSKLFIEL